MAEDFDVEAMLEAPYKKGDDGSSSKTASQRENGTSSSHKSSGKLFCTMQCNSSVIGEYGVVTCLGSCNMLPWFISRPSLNLSYHALGNVIKNDTRKSKHRSRSREGRRSRSRSHHHERDRQREKDRSERQHSRSRSHHCEKHGERRKSKEKETQHHSRDRERERTRERKKKSLSPILLPRARDKFPFKKGSPPLGLFVNHYTLYCGWTTYFSESTMLPYYLKPKQFVFRTNILITEMAEDFDVEAMLEAPYKKGDDGSSSKTASQRENGTSSSHKSSGKSKHRSRSREGRRSRSRSHHHERDRQREKDRSERQHSRSRSHHCEKHGERRKSKEKETQHHSRDRERERTRERKKKSLSPILLPRARDKFPFKKGSPPLGLRPVDELSPEERDARTVFCMQLSQRIRARDLEEFFSSVGKVRDVRLITCNKTRRFKGIAYVEFKDPESVPLVSFCSNHVWPLCIQFHNADDAKKALEQLNGFELAGRPMKVGNVTERSDSAQGPSILDSDELDRTGIDLGATGRLQLMFKLAEGTGLQIPQAAATALNLNPAGSLPIQQPTPPIATQCFMLANMFDPAMETNPTWDVEIRDDVIEECNKHGGVLHVYVDKASPQGNVYVKCPSIATAVAAVNSLHGRWFAGRVITAAYVPLINYHSLFPDAMTALQLLMPSAARRGL
ncbi:RNA-binding protein 39 [Zootermopsis nevadensis]|uniref:RNA-binding protein 39 n=1 Tax=Zootermopsis nevadensis TaxID=136037 RepID=UPI000B8EB0C7|nr:RNA-binding protein 39 [Zootermopsis nevadensis]